MPDNWYFSTLNEEWNDEQASMTPTNQEVEAVAKLCPCELARKRGHTILCFACSGPVGMDQARAAITALDQVREGMSSGPR